jgi:hypothetical protein
MEKNHYSSIFLYFIYVELIKTFGLQIEPVQT